MHLTILTLIGYEQERGDMATHTLLRRKEMLCA
jgi:hypothetical protein